jgi:hypothetical protein
VGENLLEWSNKGEDVSVTEERLGSVGWWFERTDIMLAVIDTTGR